MDVIVIILYIMDVSFSLLVRFHSIQRRCQQHFEGRSLFFRMSFSAILRDPPSMYFWHLPIYQNKKLNFIYEIVDDQLVYITKFWEMQRLLVMQQNINKKFIVPICDSKNTMFRILIVFRLFGSYFDNFFQHWISKGGHFQCGLRMTYNYVLF